MEVTASDVFEFLAHQRGDRTVVRLADGESGLSAGMIARRLSSVSGLYAYLVARGDTPVQVNPVPRGLLTRRQGGSVRSRTVPLVRVPRTLPRILPPQEADRLIAALRTQRDRAMVLAMLLAGLRRCEVLGLRFEDVQVADRRLAVVEGKGGHRRVVPAAAGSSGRSVITCMTSGRLRRPRTGCSWCSRVRGGACRCRRKGWMRSSMAPAAALAWPTPPATSCGIRA